MIAEKVVSRYVQIMLVLWVVSGMFVIPSHILEA